MANNSSISSSKRLYRLYHWRIAAVTLALVIMGNILIGHIMPRYDSNDLIGRSINPRLVEGGDYDVIFLGDSRCHQGLDPRAFEQAQKNSSHPLMTAINLGRPGLQTPFAYFIFADYVKNAVEKPKVLVVNFSFYLLGGDQWMQDIYWAYYQPKAWQVIDAMRHRIVTPTGAARWLARSEIDTFRYRKRLSNMLSSALRAPESLQNEFSGIADSIAKQYNPETRGYLSRGNESINESQVPEPSYTVGFERGYSSYFIYMKKLFDFARDNQIHVVIYDFPWPKKMNTQNLHDALNYYYPMMKKQAENNPYIHFYEKPLFWPTQYFVDPLHVNQRGAEKLSTYVLQLVEKTLKAQMPSANSGTSPKS
jgi:hypothetical protein